MTEVVWSTAGTWSLQGLSVSCLLASDTALSAHIQRRGAGYICHRTDDMMDYPCHCQCIQNYFAADKMVSFFPLGKEKLFFLPSSWFCKFPHNQIRTKDPTPCYAILVVSITLLVSILLLEGLQTWKFDFSGHAFQKDDSIQVLQAISFHPQCILIIRSSAQYFVCSIWAYNE